MEVRIGTKTQPSARAKAHLGYSALCLVPDAARVPLAKASFWPAGRTAGVIGMRLPTIALGLLAFAYPLREKGMQTFLQDVRRFLGQWRTMTSIDEPSRCCCSSSSTIPALRHP
jgi:hypothetical protein